MLDTKIYSYTVQKGETLMDISKRFKTRPIDIIKINNIPKGLNTIPEGMELKFERNISYVC